MKRCFLSLLFIASACGGSPTQPRPDPQPTTVTVSGRIVATLTGEPVAGASLNFSGRTVTTSSDGRWSLDGQNRDATLPVEISAVGFLTRSTRVQTQSGRSDVTLDLIRDGGEFSLGFYRQLVRNGFASPGSVSVEPLRRWTRNPNFYIRTLNPKTGQSISGDELAGIESTIRSVVADLTGGALQAGAIASGTDERQQAAGTITINLSYEPSNQQCGVAFVGSDPGLVTLNYERCACGANGVPPYLVAHELGHAMGLRHVESGTMESTIRPCGSASFSPAELYHARIAYSRQPGNMDIDRDGAGVALFQAPGGSPPVVSCFRRH